MTTTNEPELVQMLEFRMKITYFQQSSVLNKSQHFLQGSPQIPAGFAVFSADAAQRPSRRNSTLQENESRLWNKLDVHPQLNFLRRDPLAKQRSRFSSYFRHNIRRIAARCGLTRNNWGNAGVNLLR